MVPQRTSSRVRKILSRLLYFYIPVAGLGAGCASTGLTIPPPEPAIERLAALAPHAVKLSVTAPTAPFSLGHQYLLVAIPFGSIALIDPQTALQRALSTELAIAGIRALAEGSASSVPVVTVTPVDLRTSAFDFLLTRRVKATVRLGVTVTFPDPTEPALHFEVAGDNGSFERFGFTPELSQALGEALAEAGRGLVTALQSLRRFRYDAPDFTLRGPLPPRPIIRRAR